jgi:hypothetical protein
VDTTCEPPKPQVTCREVPRRQQIGMAMTTIARPPRPAQSRHEIDVRCSAALPHATADQGRCQLFAGHDGPHAVMFAHCGSRVVRLWKTGRPPELADAGPEALRRPWMFGYPMPAWFETEAAEPAD